VKADDTQQIRRMLIVRVFLLPFAVLLLVCGTIVYFFAAYSNRQIKNELVRIAADHRNLIQQFLNETISVLQFIATSFPIEQLSDGPTLESIFKNLQGQSKIFFDIGVFDAQGNHIAYAGPYDLVGKSYAQADWFKAIQDQEVFISDEFLGYRKIPHFVIAVRRRQNKAVWYLRATIDTYYFNDLVENVRIGQTGEAYIVNRQGILQTRRRSGGRIMDRDADFPADRSIAFQDLVYFSQGNLMSRFIYASVPIDQTGWFLMVRQTMADAYAPLTYSIMVSLILLAVAGSAVIVTGYWMADNVAGRLKMADMQTREMRTQLILAGKMAEVGEMSTGIAHEINNPLQVMKSELAMLKFITEDIEPVLAAQAPDKLNTLKDCAAAVDLQIERCRKITQGLLNFSRETENTLAPVRLQTFVPQIVSMVDRRARLENIRIVQQIDADLPDIISNAGQLQQVFLNLLNNAIYALKGRPQAEIRIQVSQNGNEMIITVADNGCGFQPEEMEKAFMPFFTTKPVGLGTGLGLSTVYGIIKGLGGDITLTSEPNAGSVFLIRLPLNSDAPLPAVASDDDAQARMFGQMPATTKG
jgi:two-component system NtrC family sensor kinase